MTDTPEPLFCVECGKECTQNHRMCDEPENSEKVWCPDCFPKTPCGRGEHGEECPTFVMVI